VILETWTGRDLDVFKGKVSAKLEAHDIAAISNTEVNGTIQNLSMNFSTLETRISY
ncbi:hypothetical protein AOQ84DRAFT_296942, partial [Glonium stellatum]